MSEEKSCKCPDCGCDEMMEVVEITVSHPTGTGYMIWVCARCGEPVRGKEPRFVGF